MDQEQERNCRQLIVSEDVGDFFVEYRGVVGDILGRLGGECLQVINNKYLIMHFKINNLQDVQDYNYVYSSFPKLYGLMDTSNIENIGVNKIRRQSFLSLYGKDVIIGFVDTGIDYRNQIFRNADGTSRILSIWDQTIQTGFLPSGFEYGSEYTNEQLNAALASEDPLLIVPSNDENGHGTILASVAAGNIDDTNEFSGVAPLSDIMVVKLKPAKQMFRNYYFTSENAVAFQENDIIMAVKYLLRRSVDLNKPIVICLGVGTNSGGHDGSGILDQFLRTNADSSQTCIVTCTGNEANAGGHYRGTIAPSQEYEDVEIRVGPQEKGFYVELWVNAPSVYAVGLTSPSGEVIEKIAPRTNNSQIVSFVFEPTKVYIDYRIIELRTGDELVFMRFDAPSEGIWKIRIFPEQNFSNYYDMWLPIREFLSADTQFVRPNPDVTITDPGNTENLITVAAFNHTNNSIYISSGRGYTRKGRVKPSIAAPGVNITVGLPDNGFSTRSGTSIAAAHAAGGAALLMEWGIVKGNLSSLDTSDIESLMIRGAKRAPNQVYPNNERGYGTLDVFSAFESLRSSI